MDLGRDNVEAVLGRWLPDFLAGRRAQPDLYADEVATWHAATNTETPIDPTADELPSFARLQQVVPDLRRENTRVEVFDAGWLLQTTTVGTVDGAEVRVPAAIVVRLDDDGRIHRFEEYADSAAAAPFARALQDPLRP